MSHWTHVIGTLRVSPMGRTQPEKRYILETVLAHLPLVTGSERDMEIHINVGGGASGSCSCDEFDMRTDKGKDWYGNRSRKGMFDIEEDYLLTVVGNLRDREFDETHKEFQKWLTRLAKRVVVDEICVKIWAEYGQQIIISDPTPYGDMFEWPSWCKDSGGEPNWCEYLMWKRWKDTPLPLELVYKYYNDEEADDEYERKMKLK